MHTHFAMLAATAIAAGVVNGASVESRGVLADSLEMHSAGLESRMTVEKTSDGRQLFTRLFGDNPRLPVTPWPYKRPPLEDPHEVDPTYPPQVARTAAGDDVKNVTTKPTTTIGGGVGPDGGSPAPTDAGAGIGGLGSLDSAALQQKLASSSAGGTTASLTSPAATFSDPGANSDKASMAGLPTAFGGATGASAGTGSRVMYVTPDQLNQFFGGGGQLLGSGGSGGMGLGGGSATSPLRSGKTSMGAGDVSGGIDAATLAQLMQAQSASKVASGATTGTGAGAAFPSGSPASPTGIPSFGAQSRDVYDYLLQTRDVGRGGDVFTYPYSSHLTARGWNDYDLARLIYGRDDGTPIPGSPSAPTKASDPKKLASASGTTSGTPLSIPASLTADGKILLDLPSLMQAVSVGGATAPTPGATAATTSSPPTSQQRSVPSYRKQAMPPSTQGPYRRNPTNSKDFEGSPMFSGEQERRGLGTDVVDSLAESVGSAANKTSKMVNKVTDKLKHLGQEDVKQSKTSDAVASPGAGARGVASAMMMAGAVAMGVFTLL